MALERAPLLADDVRKGAGWCRAHSQLIDAWLAELFAAASGDTGGGLALVAVGGYGREELCPASDIDVMLLHDGVPNVAAVADALWYPIWDTGIHLGHSVATPKEALTLAADDLDSATALLSARLVAGDAGLAGKLAASGAAQWRGRGPRWLQLLAARVEERHASSPEVAFCLEPDLKDGRGGLRDVHSIAWAEQAGVAVPPSDAAKLRDAYAVLLDARVELQRASQRPTNLLTMQEQDSVARALGFESADTLMARVAEAARTIAWSSDDFWRQVTAPKRSRWRFSKPRRVAPGIELHAGEVRLDRDQPVDDPWLGLRLAVAAATNVAAIERASLDRVADTATAIVDDPWPEEARQLLVDLLSTGRAAIPAIESLDQRGVWTRILPEWQAVRAKPQRNAYHRFTVDRHLLEATANAATLAAGVARPDLLVVGALLHDLGKGYPGDHTEAGIDLARRIGTRMGFPSPDVVALEQMVRHHLLLADVATRRDIDDPATVARVAEEVGTVGTLQRLAALTEADSRATGPAAWTPWKSELIAQLVERVTDVLAGSDPTGRAMFPSQAQKVDLDAGGQHITASGNVLTVVDDDRPGLFSRVAGVLAIHGLDVLAAAAYSSDGGRALAEFRVTDPFRDAIRWPPVVRDLELALAGQLAVASRVAERARTYAARRPVGRPEPTTVTFDNEASPSSTVIDVHANDGIGVLYRITRALADLDLDIRSARVQTLGPHVVDAFYVRHRTGQKVTDAATMAEIERAIVHSVDVH